jgi:hypothetical protein
MDRLEIQQAMDAVIEKALDAQLAKSGGNVCFTSEEKRRDFVTAFVDDATQDFWRHPKAAEMFVKTVTFAFVERFLIAWEKRSIDDDAG